MQCLDVQALSSPRRTVQHTCNTGCSIAVETLAGFIGTGVSAGWAGLAGTVRDCTVSPGICVRPDSLAVGPFLTLSCRQKSSTLMPGGCVIGQLAGLRQKIVRMHTIFERFGLDLGRSEHTRLSCAIKSRFLRASFDLSCEATRFQICKMHLHAHQLQLKRPWYNVSVANCCTS